MNNMRPIGNGGSFLLKKVLTHAPCVLTPNRKAKALEVGHGNLERNGLLHRRDKTGVKAKDGLGSSVPPERG